MEKKSLKNKLICGVIICIIVLNTLPTIKKTINQTNDVKSNFVLKENQTILNSTHDYNFQYINGWSQNFGAVKDMIIKDELLYLVGGDKELFILNINEINNPYLLGSYSNQSKAISSVLNDQYLYIGLEDEGMKLINIQNSTYPIEAYQYLRPISVYDICIFETYAFLAIGSNGFEVVNIEDPINPYHVTTVTTDGFTKQLVVVDSNLFIADGTDGLEVYDISNINSPSKIGNYTDGSNFFSLKLKNDYALTLDEGDKLKLFNISNPSNIQKVSEYEIQNPRKLSLYNEFAFVSSYDVLKIINFSTPNNLVEINNYTATDRIIDLEIKNNLLFLGSKGIEVIQITTHSLNLELINHFSEGQIDNIILSEGLLYTTTNDEILILDIREPTNITTIGKYSVNGTIAEISKHGKFLYIAKENFGIEVLDIENPEVIEKVGDYSSIGAAVSLCLKDNFLFLADGEAGIVVLDISNPAKPEEIKIVTKHISNCIKVKLFEEKLCAIDAVIGAGLVIFDYSELITKNGEIENHLRIPGYFMSLFTDVALQDDIAFVCTGNNLLIYDISNANEINLIQTISEGVYYHIQLIKNSLYTKGINSVQIFEIKNIRKISRIELKINGSYLNNFLVDGNNILVTNTNQGDDILVFYHDPLKSFSSLYVIIPVIIGVTVIIATFYIIIKIKKKKNRHKRDSN